MIKRKPLPARDVLVAHLQYDQATGALTWLPRGDAKWDGRNAGRNAGRLNKGAIEVSLFGARWQAHRIIWKMMHGDEPECIDHVNGVRGDNRLCNLRAATCLQNMGNKRKVRSSSGIKGVSKNGSGWQAAMSVNGKRVTFGTFKTKEEAAAVYDAEAVKRFGDFAATNAALGLAAY